MKHYLTLAGFVYLLFMLTGCNALFFKQHNKNSIPPEEKKAQMLQQELDQLSSYLIADYPEDSGDSLDVELQYFYALEKLDSLTLVYGPDSGIAELRHQVSRSYNRYLDWLLGFHEDTLSTDLVMQDLSDIYAEAFDTLTTAKIPLVTNVKVERAIKYFTQGRGRKIFAVWLQRTGLYEDLVKGILRKEGAPEELFYLAMIESGLNPQARSYARAVGMWQFISATGRAYGLDHSWWYDKRRDPVQASRAAARHLLDLYDRFGDWYLAIAGYNFNPSKIEKRLAAYNVNEFWELPRLPRQTRNYVPTYLAAVTIAKQPAKYGFDVTVTPPIEFDTVTVRECVDLNVVAECIGSTFSELKNLNPALLRWCTPPDVDRWLLNLPKGTRETFMAKYAEIPKEDKITWVHHRIRPGETLSTIAARYRVSMYEIKRFNNIRGSLIRAGHSLVIPVPKDKKYYTNYVAKTTPPRQTHRSKPVANVPGREKNIYVVKKGDTLWDVARRFGVTINQIREWNGLGYSRIIQPGQRLNIWLRPGVLSMTNTNSMLAGTAAPDIQSQSAVSPSTEKTIIHTVRYGDTLWDIARAYAVSIRDIKRWNGKRNNVIRPGEELKILQN